MKKQPARAVIKKAWNYVKKDIETSDKDVAKKKIPFLSRLYHTLNRTFQSLDKKIIAGEIDPFVKLKSRKFSREKGASQFHSVNRPIRAGFFAFGANPLWWGHILVTLMAAEQLNLDTVIWRAQGEIRYKDFPETDRVPVKDRHEITQKVLTDFFPLFRYTDLGSEPDSEREGADEMQRYFALNPKTKLHLYYLIGVESPARLRKYFPQHYEAVKKYRWGGNPHHQYSIGWIQRGEYGAKITVEDLQKMSARYRKRHRFNQTLGCALVKDRDIDLQVSSTYYRNTHDPAILPRLVDQHAKAHGFYGHPPIDPRTDKPYDYTEEEHFKHKLRPVAESIANQVVRQAERVGRGKSLVISIDGPSGSGKTTLGQEVGKFLKLRSYQFVHIPFDIFLKSKTWRSALEKRVLGQPLLDQEKKLLGQTFTKIKPTKKFLQEEITWRIEDRERLVKQIDRFRRGKKKEVVLVVRSGYDRPTKKMKDFRFKLKPGMVVIIDGKYCHREELAPYYDLRYRLDDNPDRTKAKFEMRTRSLSPATADNQMLFYDVALIPSFEAYAKRTKKAIDYVVDLSTDDWGVRGA